MKTTNYHKSVLPEEVLRELRVSPGKVYLDTTLGGGGHTQSILELGAQVIALDMDIDAIKHAQEKFDLSEQDGVWVTRDSRLKIIKTNFKDLDQALTKVSVSHLAGVLFDLGVSSHMFDQGSRGFSFSQDGPLDMRMSQELSVTAADLANGLNEGELYELFTKLGEVPYARRLARAICRSRLEKKIETTYQLKEIVRSVVKNKKEETTETAKVFMALRIAVNDELNNLKTALPKAVECLESGGRLVVISFHSLEDRIVKEFIKKTASLVEISEKPITADVSETQINSRSRSAKMRVAEKTLSLAN